MTTRVVSNMHEISILMWCTWHFKKTSTGYDAVDDKHEVHSVYANQIDAQEAAKFHKNDDMKSGLCCSRYWVIDVPVENQAPTEETING